MKIQKLLPGFEIFQFLTNFSVNSSLILNSIYFMQKKKIQNMLQVYFRKNKLQSKNIQTVPKYQFKYQSFKHERGKSEFEIIIQIPIMAI